MESDKTHLSPIIRGAWAMFAMGMMLDQQHHHHQQHGQQARDGENTHGERPPAEGWLEHPASIAPITQAFGLAFGPAPPMLGVVRILGRPLAEAM